MRLLDRLNFVIGKIKTILESSNTPDIYEDRQVAEDRLFHTMGPLTKTPKWVNAWTSKTPQPPDFIPLGPAPTWTQDEVVFAMAGDPKMLFTGNRDNPKSPKYGTMGGSPLYRTALRVARTYKKDKDQQFIADMYGNGFVALTNAMRDGADEARTNFISWCIRSIQSAMEHGVGGSTAGIRANAGESKSGTIGLDTVFKTTDPARLREIANQVTGKYQTLKSNDKAPGNPFGVFSSRFYQEVTAYADAIESGDEDKKEAAINRLEQLRGSIEDSSILVPGASSGMGTAINTSNRGNDTCDECKGKKEVLGPDGVMQKCNKCNGYGTIKNYAKVSSMDYKKDDEAGSLGDTMASNDHKDNWINPETVRYVLDIALKYDIGRLLGKSHKYRQIAIDAGAKPENDGSVKMGGTLTGNEFRFIIRSLGHLSSEYPGKGVLRSSKSPRDSVGWWKPGEDPEIEQIPGSNELWKSIWSRDGYSAMGSTDISREMTEEVREFMNLNIPTGRVIKDKGNVQEVVSKVAVSNTVKTAFIKLKLIAYAERSQLGLDESLKNSLKETGLLIEHNSVDRDIINDAFDYVVNNIKWRIINESM